MTTPNVCPTAPDGFVACRTTHGPGGSSTVQVTHLVRLDAHGSNGGRPTMCGLTRFDKRSPDGWDVIELAAIPGWSMGAGGISGPGITQKACDACWTAARPAAGSSSPDVTALADELRNAILDIDAHATPFGTDDDGFVSGGYLISVGSLHRALGVVGHSAAKCGGCRNCWTLDQWKAEEQLLRDELEAQAARITELERWKAEALVVLGQWDEVWEALGRPGPLGSSKAVEALTEAHRLRATDPPADGPDPCPHCTPAAGSSSPDTAALVAELRGPSGLASTSRAKHLTVGVCAVAADALEAQASRITELEQFLIRLGHNPDRLDLP